MNLNEYSIPAGLKHPGNGYRFIDDDERDVHYDSMIVEYWGNGRWIPCTSTTLSSILPHRTQLTRTELSKRKRNLSC